MSAIFAETAAPTGRRWVYALCLLYAGFFLGCAAEVADEAALEDSSDQEVAVRTQALGNSVDVATGLGRVYAWNGDFGVFVTSGSDCAVTPYRVHRLRLSASTVTTWNLGCRRIVQAAVAPNGVVHAAIGGAPIDPNYRDIITLTGGLPKRADITGSIRGIRATDTQIFWSDDLGLHSMNSDGSSPRVLLAEPNTSLMGIDGGLLIFGRSVQNGQGLAICEMWTNGLFLFEHFRFLGNLPITITWDPDNFYYAFESGSISSFSRWPGGGFTSLYRAPAGYTLAALDDSSGNLYFSQRNTATGVTDILRRSSNGAVTTQKTNVGSLFYQGLYVRSAYLFWGNSAGTVKKASLP